MKLKNLFIKLLENFGDAGEIYNAMDSGPFEMVMAAERAITKLNIVKDISFVNKKSEEKSKELRTIGNGHYGSGKNKEALIFYNMAIAYAQPGSNEMLLAVGNRSAVLFTMKSFKCISDINICLTMGCRPDLEMKLNKRRLESKAFFEEEIIRDMTSINQFMASFFTTDFKNHKVVHSASSDVAFLSKDGVRKITAKRRIAPGKIVAIEPAFVSCGDKGYNYLCCYYCNKLILNPSPCSKCCYAMFCSEDCLNLCLNDYHSVECQIIDLLEKLYGDPQIVLTVRAAIKLSLKLGWDGFITASEKIGSCRMKDSPTKEMYSIEEPLSMLTYDDNQELLEGRMFNGSIVCAIVLKHFDKVPNYYPKETTKRAAAKKAMSKIMLHLYIHFTNTVFFSNSSYELKSKGYKYAMKTCMGWFSMTSKIKHSCQPNLLIIGLNDHIALLAIKTIEKGEELTISFVDLFLDYDLNRNSINTLNFRASHLFLRTRKICSCDVCEEEWCVSDLKHEPMTDRQTDLYRKLQGIREICVDREGFQTVCEVLDTFSIKSKQYQEAYVMLKRFLSLCQCKLSNNQAYSDD